MKRAVSTRLPSSIHSNSVRVVMSNDAWDHGGSSAGADLLKTTVFAEIFDNKLVVFTRSHSFITPLGHCG